MQKRKYHKEENTELKRTFKTRERLYLICQLEQMKILIEENLTIEFFKIWLPFKFTQI